MFVDTSAFISLLAGEPGAGRLAEALSSALLRQEPCLTSALVRLETCMRLATKLDISPERAQLAFDQLLHEAEIEVMPITDAVGRVAVEAFSRYGKGRGHPAQLNLADCLSYACTMTTGTTILFIGDDFSRTDASSALPDR